MEDLVLTSIAKTNQDHKSRGFLQFCHGPAMVVASKGNCLLPLENDTYECLTCDLD